MSDSDFDDSALAALDEMIDIAVHNTVSSSNLPSHLDDAQKSAVIAPLDIPLIIVASAGSGKTTVMAHRVQRFISCHKVEPSRILAVTFTVRAARELSRRIGNPAVQVGTFHSICLRILYANLQYLPLSEKFTIISRRDAISIIGPVLRSHKHTGSDNFNDPQSEASALKEECEALLVLIERYKNKDMAPEALSSSSIERLAYQEYQKQLRERNAIDFIDMIGMIVALFRTKPDVCQRYRDTCRYILVDEFQDTARLQWEFLRLIGGCGITVVGDDDQSIYGFRGASSQIFSDFRAHFSGCNQVTLNTNYRSSKTIVDVASKIITRNVFRESKSLTAWPSAATGSCVQLNVFDSLESEAEWVANEIIQRRLPYGSTAVLCRLRKNTLQLFAKAFRRKGIPCSLSSSTSGAVPGSAVSTDGYSVADGPILQSTLLACLELVANEGNDVALLQVVNKPKRGIGQGMIGFLQSLPMSESDHPSLLARMRRAVATDFTLSHVPSASAASSRRPSTKAREGVSSFLTWYDSLKARAFHCRVSELFECVMRQLQYDPSEDWEIDEAIAERIPILNQIVAIEDTEGHILATIDDPLMRIRFVLGHLQIVSVEDDDQLPDGNVQSQADFRRKASKEHVTLTTIHQAKGLEWPFVFIIRANEGVFPVSPAVDVRSAEQAAHMEEERRLAYVAFTRAMEKLYITSAVMDDRGRISRFVWDIPSEHLLVPPNMTVEDLKRHPYKLVTSDRTIGGVRTSVGQPTHESTLGKRNRLMSPESTHTDGIESRGGKMSKWTR